MKIEADSSLHSIEQEFKRDRRRQNRYTAAWLILLLLLLLLIGTGSFIYFAR